jgi:exosortase family protein XrtF
MLKEFKPTILFLVKFALIFGIGSFAYGSYIKSFHNPENPKPDSFTNWVAVQSNGMLHMLGYKTKLYYPEKSPIIDIYIDNEEQNGVAFYEGCNGLNIMILFVAFVFAFSNNYKTMLWFIPAGLVAIHIFNLLRIVSLTIMATVNSTAFHFFHKYAFTGVIYVFVFFLWYLWATKFSNVTTKDAE